MVYYVTTILVYAGVDAIACLGLSQQFGFAGVTNFGFILFQAAGAYAAGVLSLPPETANGGFQTYIGGLNLPFPLPWIGAAVVGGLISVPFALIVGKRLRGDFAAIGLLVTAVMFNLLVTNYKPLVNGVAGLSLVPSPLQNQFNPQSSGYQWLYGAVVVPVAFEEATRYIPPVSGNPNLVPALQWVVIGLLIVVFLWFRPQGIIPERRRVILGKRAGPDPLPATPAAAPLPVLGGRS